MDIYVARLMHFEDDARFWDEDNFPAKIVGVEADTLQNAIRILGFEHPDLEVSEIYLQA